MPPPVQYYDVCGLNSHHSSLPEGRLGRRTRAPLRSLAAAAYAHKFEELKSLPIPEKNKRKFWRENRKKGKVMSFILFLAQEIKIKIKSTLFEEIAVYNVSNL
ncbi:MAG: hypothetical protein RBG13Loki_3742 [Promethearchaeota archaeon CR_4]|nr:MAG: hypothetical protein RBG13Loki_3742 [Candidatus Lokiarchaeota archaeon CR_4]